MPPRRQPLARPSPTLVGLSHHFHRLRSRLRRRSLIGRLAAVGLGVAAVTATRALAPDDGDASGSVPAATAPVSPTAEAAELGPGTGSSLGLAPGERAIAVARPLATPPLAPGDLVELIAVAGVDGPDGARSTQALPIGPPVRVLAVDGTSITIAVPADLAPTIVSHHASGPIEIVLTPGAKR